MEDKNQSVRKPSSELDKKEKQNVTKQKQLYLFIM